MHIQYFFDLTFSIKKSLMEVQSKMDRKNITSGSWSLCLKIHNQ